MNRFSFTIPGRPVPKERPRMGRGRRVFTPARTKEYEHFVGNSCRAALAAWNLGGRDWQTGATYKVEVTCYFKRGNTPDCDNLAKSILDGMNGIAYDDDRQVTWVSVMKCTGDERAEVTVIRLSDAPKAKRAHVNIDGADRLMGIFGMKRVRARKGRK